MKTFTMFAATLVLFAPTIGAAQDWTPAEEGRLSEAYNSCADAGAGAMPATIRCSQAEYGKQDARLNQSYRMVMARLSLSQRKVLRTSQRAWIRDRDRTCQQRWDQAGGGQASDLEQSSCLLHQTVTRTMWLERYR